MRRMVLSILLAFCLTVPGQWAEASKEPRQVNIVSNPTRARVFVNGHDRGYTPIDDTLVLGFGDRIEAHAPGFMPWHQVLTTVPSDTLFIGLQRQKARLAILSNQLNVLGAEIRAYFVDADTTFTGFLSMGKTGLAYQADVFVGKYQLEIVRPEYEPFFAEVFVPEKGTQLQISLKRKPLKLNPVAKEGLRQLAESYRKDSAQLLASALALSENDLSSGPDISLFDERLTLFIEAFEHYETHLQELERLASQEGWWDTETYRSIAQIYAYKGILLGKFRRFAQAHALFEKAREMSPFLDQEPSPLPRDTNQKTLGDAMAYVESQYEQLGRVDVYVGSLWMVEKELRSKPLRFTRRPSLAESTNRLTLDPAQAAQQDSLLSLAEHVLQDSILSGAKAFSLYLPKGAYAIQDTAELLVATEFLVDQPVSIQLEPRVHVWLPEVTTPADTVMVRAVKYNTPGPGPLVKPAQITFGQVYDLVIRTNNYNRHEERIVFYQKGGIEPILPDVTAISARPGEACLYFQEGSDKLKKQRSWTPKKGMLKYILLPIGAGLSLLVL